MKQTDQLIKALLKNQEALLKVLETLHMKDDDESEDSDMMEGMEDKLTNAMVKAIKMTRSPNRTFGTNGSYS